MRTTAAIVLGSLAFQLGAGPAFAAETTEPDTHLHLVTQEHTVYVGRTIVQHRRHWYGRERWRTEIVTPTKLYDVFIAQGPFRINEDQFLALIDRSGTSPQFIAGIREHEATTTRHGWLAVGSWLGTAAALGLAESRLAPTVGLGLSGSPDTVTLNTGEVAAVALGLTGLVTTIMWFGDSQPKGAPYFRQFTPGEAQEAIDRYNRNLDQQGPLTPAEAPSHPHHPAVSSGIGDHAAP
jgi:hypothetical protein